MHFEVFTAQEENGAANALVVNQFEAQLIGTRAMEYEVIQRIKIGENFINTLLGRFPQTIIRSTIPYEHAFDPKLANGVPSELLRNRPDIRTSQRYNM